MAQATLLVVAFACLMATITSGTTEALPRASGGSGQPPASVLSTTVMEAGGSGQAVATVGGGLSTTVTEAGGSGEAAATVGGGGGGLSTTVTEAGGSGQAAAVTGGGLSDSTSTIDTETTKVLRGGGRLPLWVERLLTLGGGRPSLGDMEGTTVVVVAKNGDGQFKSITAALAAQKDQIGSIQSILTIVIKEGVYAENLNITRKHVILIGEGAGKTVITGNKSHRFHNLSTPDTATLSVHGMGFMAQDLTIQNTAGPEGLQAVALMSRSHFSLVYRCSIEGYQDTLGADTGDQMYLDTDIRGTVDFIFGYARAVFLGCRLLVRSSGTGNHNVVTAQGRSNPLDRSGFAFQNCSVTADDGINLTGVETFLGRPWKEHSHVIFMETFLDAIVNFTGWVEWNRSSGHIPDTVVYLEYANYGPGADTSRRINSTSVQVITDCHVAAQYTADPFANASAWMPKDKEGRDIIPYPHGLIRGPACPPASPSPTSRA